MSSQSSSCISSPKRILRSTFTFFHLLMDPLLYLPWAFHVFNYQMRHAFIRRMHQHAAYAKNPLPQGALDAQIPHAIEQNLLFFQV